MTKPTTSVGAEGLYHPGAGAADPEQWQELDELERIELVLNAHSQLDEKHPPLEDLRMHAIFHVIVENQLSLADDVGKVARATLERFVESGFDRHEAVHALGSVVASHVFAATREERVSTDDLLEEDLRRFSPEEWRKAATASRPGRRRTSRGSKRRARSPRRRR